METGREETLLNIEQIISVYVYNYIPRDCNNNKNLSDERLLKVWKVASFMLCPHGSIER